MAVETDGEARLNVSC